MPWPKAGARLIQAPGVNRTCRPSLVTLLTIFRPDRIVIGGAAGQYFGLFEGGLHRSLNRAARVHLEAHHVHRRTRQSPPSRRSSNNGAHKKRRA
jgi:hypothetical protein